MAITRCSDNKGFCRCWVPPKGGPSGSPATRPAGPIGVVRQYTPRLLALVSYATAILLEDRLRLSPTCREPTGDMRFDAAAIWGRMQSTEKGLDVEI